MFLRCVFAEAINNFARDFYSCFSSACRGKIKISWIAHKTRRISKWIMSFLLMLWFA